MFKTISAALIAVSVLAAPAIAATSAGTTQAPATKSANLNKPAQVKKTKIGHRHHVPHYAHHRSHKKMTGKVHKSPKVAAKHVTHPAKRG